MTTQDHHQFEGLAVNHVLGGLQQEDADRFRTHLMECRQCRLHVAELQDIASGLEEAAEDEMGGGGSRRAQVVAPPPAWLTTPRLAMLALIVVVGGAGVFWITHIQRVSSGFEQTAELQGQVLRILSDGDLLPVELTSSTRAVIARDGDQIALSLSELPELSSGERVVVWLANADGTNSPELFLLASSDGRALGLVARQTANRLIVTVEVLPLGDEPGGQHLLSVSFTG